MNIATDGRPGFAAGIDIRQYSGVSNQELPLIQECRTPLVAEPLSELEAVGFSLVFKALADPVRLRLLSLIASFAGGEACVCDLTEPFNLTQPTISHHLKVLREAGLVTSERRATWVYYKAVPEALAALADLLSVPARSPR
jgi:ArsR family transcriptional regulator